MKEETRIPEINLAKEIDGTAVNLSSIADSIEYIPLETTDSSFIGQIMDIQLTKDYIFVQDRILDRLLVFQRSGKFLNQIGRAGKGPGEYHCLFTFTTDRDGQNVYLYTTSHRVLHYTVYNSYVNTIITLCGRFDYMSMIDSLFLLYIARPNRITCDGYSYFFIDKSAKVINKGHKIDPATIGESASVSYSSNYRYKDMECFWEVGFDTIYSLDRDFKLLPRYTLLLGKKIAEKTDLSSRTDFDQSIRGGALTIFSLREAGNFLYFNVVKDSKITQLIYFNDSGKLFDIGSSNTGGFTNDIDGGPGFSPSFIGNPSYLIDIKFLDSFQESVKRQETTPNKLNNPSLKILSRINEYSNPVLMVVKIRE
ncbi:MAG: 6-bladed beta-propeller [Bacteroidia bacterium]|nr:6-bladed beta-propeller [Bacteroidia bacterium]